MLPVFPSPSVKVFKVPPIAAGFVGIQVPRNSKSTAFGLAYQAKQSILDVIAYISGVPVLHGENA